MRENLQGRMSSDLHHLRQLRRFLDGDTWEPDEEKRETAAGLCLTSMAVGYALADSYEAGRTYPRGFFGVLREDTLADDVREVVREELDAHEDPLE